MASGVSYEGLFRLADQIELLQLQDKLRLEGIELQIEENEVKLAALALELEHCRVRTEEATVAVNKNFEEIHRQTDEVLYIRISVKELENRKWLKKLPFYGKCSSDF